MRVPEFVCTVAAAVLVVLLVGSGLVVPGARAEDLTGDARRFVIALHDHLQAIADMPPGDNPTEDRTARLQRFRQLFIEAFDIEAIGRYSLGRFWADTTAAEQHEFRDLFQDDLVSAYAWRFIRYAGRPLRVLRSRAHETEYTLVRTEFENASGIGADPIDWRVLKRQDGFRIVDLTVRGVSLGRLQRADYQSFLERNGGRVESLLEALRRRARGEPPERETK